MIKKFINMLKQPLTTYKFKKKWREHNSHNLTTIKNDINSIATVGNFSYGVLYVPYMQGKLKIGSLCSIADNVSFLTAGEHFTNHVSTFPFYAQVMKTSEFSGGGYK